MKIYSCPKELAYAEPDYANYDTAKEEAREAEHQQKLKDWALANGYAGERTGQVFSKPHADGYACYLFMDGPKAALMHLPYGDAWHSPDVEFLPKKEVIARMERSAGLAKLFAKA